jgi:hypothetical protein
MRRSNERWGAGRRHSGPSFLRVGRRSWYHPSVLALVREFGGSRDPETIIRGKARELVAEARAHGWTGPPFDPRALASLLDIRVHPDELRPGHDALIYPAEGQQLRIIFDLTRPPTRQNFSIFHEIVHTLFPDHFEMIRHRYQRRDRFDPDRELEYLCDVGAAELLLPEGTFRADIARFGFGLGGLPLLRERYQASREAVVRRMVQLDTNRSAAAFLEYRLKPSQVANLQQLALLPDLAPALPKLRIAYSVPSPSFGIFLPPHKSIPDDSCAYRALANGTMESGREAWDIHRLPPCHVEATALPTGDDLDAALRAVAVLKI